MSVDREPDQHQRPEIDRLIHEPARYHIMALLYVVERAEFLFVKNQTRMTAGNLSAHVSKLEAAQYILVEKEFVGKRPRTYLKLTDRGKGAFETYRATMTTWISMPFDVQGEPTPDHD